VQSEPATSPATSPAEQPAKQPAASPRGARGADDGAMLRARIARLSGCLEAYTRLCGDGGGPEARAAAGIAYCLAVKALVAMGRFSFSGEGQSDGKTLIRLGGAPTFKAAHQRNSTDIGQGRREQLDNGEGPDEQAHTLERLYSDTSFPDTIEMRGLAYGLVPGDPLTERDKEELDAWIGKQNLGFRERVTAKAPVLFPYRLRDATFVNNMIRWTEHLNRKESEDLVLAALHSLHLSDIDNRVKALLDAVGAETGDGNVRNLARATLRFGTGARAFWAAVRDKTRAARVEGLLIAVGVQVENGVFATQDARKAALDIARGISGCGFWPATGNANSAAGVKTLLIAVGVPFKDGAPDGPDARKAALDIARGSSGLSFWPATGDEKRVPRVSSFLAALGIELQQRVPVTEAGRAAALALASAFRKEFGLTEFWVALGSDKGAARLLLACCFYLGAAAAPLEMGRCCRCCCQGCCRAAALRGGGGRSFLRAGGGGAGGGCQCCCGGGGGGRGGGGGGRRRRRRRRPARWGVELGRRSRSFVQLARQVVQLARSVGMSV
jgi:hypothetical protein